MDPAALPAGAGGAKAARWPRAPIPPPDFSAAALWLMVALRDDAPPGRSQAEAGGIAMLRFTLSVAPGSIRLEQTFAELFESKHSALVVARSDGEHRLVSF